MIFKRTDHPVRAGEVNGLSAVAAGLGSLTEVGVEVRVSDDLVVAHPLARGVDDVDELRVAPVQPLAGRRRVKERPARVQPGYPAQSAPGVVAEVGGDLAAEAGADDVDGGRVDGEGRRGEQLDEAEGVLAHKTGNNELELQSISDSW